MASEYEARIEGDKDMFSVHRDLGQRRDLIVELVTRVRLVGAAGGPTVAEAAKLARRAVTDHERR